MLFDKFHFCSSLLSTLFYKDIHQNILSFLEDQKMKWARHNMKLVLQELSRESSYTFQQNRDLLKRSFLSKEIKNMRNIKCRLCKCENPDKKYKTCPDCREKMNDKYFVVMIKKKVCKLVSSGEGVCRFNIKKKHSQDKILSEIRRHTQNHVLFIDNSKRTWAVQIYSK